jgi:hypothetical protein
MRMEARVTGHPSLNRRGFVRAVVVYYQMHVELGGRGLVDRAQKGEKFLGSVPTMHFTDDLLAMSSAAKSVVVLCRLWLCVRRSTTPRASRRNHRSERMRRFFESCRRRSKISSSISRFNSSMQHETLFLISAIERRSFLQSSSCSGYF